MLVSAWNPSVLPDTSKSFNENISEGKAPRLERNSIYKDNGAILLTSRRCIEDKTLTGKKVSHITMLAEESIKINSDFEFWLAEKIISDWNNR